MKKTTLTHLLIVSTTILFTACSGTNSPEKKAQSIESIIALQQARIASLPLAQTYPVQEVAPVARTYNSSPLSYIPPRRYQRAYSAPRINPRIVNKIEWDAKKLLGKRYVWGATGPYTYDCSGFTQKIFRDAGINIPRVSREQAKVGKYVRYEELQRGDMVFFDTKKHRTGKVCHVGIYLGNGNFIHASSSKKKVVIFNFNKKSFYKKRFLWGRRVLHRNMHYASN